ncbi:3-isopropylmalate dehydrogenase [Sporolactobacillus inulinus]|uniref:3-isopropylmalate dehydrogenase n=1 Tax=Sporolactobacillus inulinus CASD TaxID=1069536 RepID=A0A0U1QP78_9BACL|nr:3-isopropylmalate dehydrogenase [Sporolactobacillus inulinus]KLI02600.1 3-isopropylmalate dehydrogenase [Sporolactobacillus inulinus CASD]GEB76713.1 3-isopropylmalate dehydrogenase [Sporolactobacillus inulinus]
MKIITVLPGDGIGPEVTASAVRVLQSVFQNSKTEVQFIEKKIGGAAIDAYGTPLPQETIDQCKRSHAILLGAVGGPKWNQQSMQLRPEQGLLGIRKAMGLFANLRPVEAFQALVDASPLKRSFVEQVDFIIVRELTGGLYFGRPSERLGPNQDRVVDTLAYSRQEIQRVVEKAFQLAMKRRRKITSIDKANVLESSRMWRELVNETSKRYPEVAVTHQLVDSAAMQLITNPSQFDVLVTENMFGDILSDEASVLTGSLGMMPSASLRADKVGLYEPAHGSAPDIAGQGKANPLATILSAALMLRYSFDMDREAKQIEAAVRDVLNQGYHTSDLQIDRPDHRTVNTTEMTDRVISAINQNETIHQ